MHEPSIYISGDVVESSTFNHKNAVQNLEILMIHLHNNLQTILET